MANYSDSVKLDRLWKLAFNKARGDSTAQHFEENIPSVVDVAASDIYAEAIDTSPPSATDTKVTVWTPGGDGRIALTRDRKYNNARVWVAKGTFSANYSSGAGSVSDIMKNFVSPKYGTNYVITVYDGGNNQIPQLDDSSWTFDYKAGVLTFESDRTETGDNTSDSIKIDAYQYIGRTLAAGPQTYTHEEASPVTPWSITHNLGRFPSVTIVDASGNVVWADIVYNNSNSITITFSSTFAGKAYLN